MEFKEMYSYLVSGRKIRRRGWEDQTIYMIMTPEEDVKCYRQECLPFYYNISIVNSKGWIILGEEEKEISFSDTIELLRKGKKIRLKDWPEDHVLECNPNGKEIFLRKNTEFAFTPTFGCLSSDDWEAIEEDLIK